MIERLIRFSLHQRFIILALAVLLTIGGIVAFHRLPIEAYPDVADVEVDVITLWPGHAAEEVERHITLQLEKELNGIANVTFLRSFSNFGLSNIRVLFAKSSCPSWTRATYGSASSSRSGSRWKTPARTSVRSGSGCSCSPRCVPSSPNSAPQTTAPTPMARTTASSTSV